MWESHIASLNRHTSKFSGIGLKITWCQPFAIQGLPKSGNPDCCPPKMAILSCSFIVAKNQYSWPNGQFLPKKHVTHVGQKLVPGIVHISHCGGSVLFFKLMYFFSIEYAKFWPRLANFGFFLSRNRHTFWCTLTVLNNVVVYQN